MRNLIFIAFLFITIYSFSQTQVIENNAFRLSNSFGDLQMRRHIDGDLVWKRALVPNATILNINHVGDFSEGVRVMGSKLIVDGNLGIGTTNPSKELEIKGGDGVGISLYNDQANYWDIINSQYGKLDFVRGKSNVFMRINQIGNVGIGTTSPGSKLTVKGNVNIGENGNYRLRVRHIDGKNHNDSNLGSLYFNYGTGKHVLVGYGGQDSNLYVSGNVGIGTTSPDAKLTVKGDIHTQEVKVDLLGAVMPDYVFNENYDLKSLLKVEAYIISNGHLPNIPSAEEVEINGLHLKEMNLKLLEKIEELTLYTIEQEKELQSQKTTNKNLENRLKKIEILLNSIKKIKS